MYAILASPLGDLLAVSDGRHLTGLYFNTHPPREAGDPAEADAMVFRETAGQLGEYFEGKRKEFDLPLHLRGTPFQLRVWHLLRTIPYGLTISYKQLAEWTGSPDSTRAVGRANGQNPISIIVPCHRVIGSNGMLVGYGGGLERKAALLDLERSHI